ncbi:hypothetical protein H072_5739 [Dactylellina haptotyla CBS 200.50]|uniref:Major facilitator superfamily (MFS) profile domain-containing protein n=1 Tax=Dactylellina haptotyla (strain CBS 200.50) TaxID=1284197 RepID=S8ABS8_DACHA|nr:hypothetical protein H072_5739 [Dactylellina haptotyla CBS 200.50]
MQEISSNKSDSGIFGLSHDASGIDDGSSAAGGATTTSRVSAFREVNEKPPLLKHLSDDEIEELEIKLKRKIDIRLLPTIIVVYIMNYLDRNNIPAAQVAGMGEELGLSTTQYNTAVSILFVGYILMQVPSNLFLDKIGRPSIYFTVVMMIWGVISGATGAVQNFSGLIACRFFLGFIEAAYFPGCLFYLSSWYTKKELSLRTAILYSGSLISGAFSGLIAAGITDGLDGKAGLSAWRWLFILEGSITVFIAFFIWMIIPDFPRTTRWLSEEERQLACWRLERDVGEEDWSGSEAQKVMHGLKLAFTDTKMYILMVLVTCCVASGSITNFFPIVVGTLGYGRIQTLLLTTPPYVLATIVVLTNAWHADRRSERYFHIIVPLTISVIAFIIAASTLNTAARYTAMMFMPASVYGGYVCALSWISSTLPRPVTKRAASLAAINAIRYANLFSPSITFVGKLLNQFPRTSVAIAMGVNCGTSFLGIIFATILRFTLVRLNRKLDHEEEAGGSGLVDGNQSAAPLNQNEVERREEEGLPGTAAVKGFRFLV